MKITYTFLALFFLSSCTVANDRFIVIPNDNSQRLIAGNLSISAESFLNAYMSQDIQQRRFAEMYLIGVIDNSEGTVWCGFDIASASAIQEQAYVGLVQSVKLTPHVRAAKAITSKLRELLPCKEQK